ncbi:hypothetical protein V1264_019145 [Littorina saxatilis]|uniref:Fibrinogen C-terminal domain-containing protein n=1 Tax=Littorina saxatilis TaxID=31220 RepID=A0AAN9BJQ3_9CAEN
MRKTLLAVLTVLSSTVATQFVSETVFRQYSLCSTDCRFVTRGRSKIHCSLQCYADSACVFWAWDSNPGLCRLCANVAEENCAEIGHAVLPGYLRTVCQNGGTLDISRWRCSCFAGFAGDVCQRRIYDCSEGFHLNYPTRVYEIQPPLATSPFSVYCRMTFGGRTYIATRTHPDLQFNRTWEEYKNGFGNVSGDYWIGLEQIYLLTNNGLDNELKIEIRNSTDFHFQQYYYYFRISDESSYYQLHFASTKPNAQPGKALGDSLSPALGCRFSTYDADHDGDDTENCALRHQSGWWFPSPCNLTKGNPLGRLGQPGMWSGNPEDAFWFTDFGNRALLHVHMWLVM